MRLSLPVSVSQQLSKSTLTSLCTYSHLLNRIIKKTQFSLDHSISDAGGSHLNKTAKEEDQSKRGPSGLWKLGVSPSTSVQGRYARPDHGPSDSE